MKDEQLTLDPPNPTLEEERRTMTLLLADIPADQAPSVSELEQWRARRRNDRIVHLYKTMTQREIAEEVGVSKTTVARVLEKYGVKPRPNYRRTNAVIEAEKAKCPATSAR